MSAKRLIIIHTHDSRFTIHDSRLTMN